MSHSTFHSNNLTSQPGSHKNEKKYREEKTHSPPKTGIETRADEVLHRTQPVGLTTAAFGFIFTFALISSGFNGLFFLIIKYIHLSYKQTFRLQNILVKTFNVR